MYHTLQLCMCVHVCKARARLHRGEDFSGGRGFRTGRGAGLSPAGARLTRDHQATGGPWASFLGDQRLGAVSREDKSQAQAAGTKPPGRASPTSPRAAPAHSPPAASSPSWEPCLLFPLYFQTKQKCRQHGQLVQAREHCPHTWTLQSAERCLSSAWDLSGAGTGGRPCSLGADSRISSLALPA